MNNIIKDAGWWDQPSPDNLCLRHWISISSRAPALFVSLTFDLPEEKREFPSVAAQSTPGGFVWVLSGMWWFSLLPPHTRELGQGYEGQVVVVVKVWGQSEIQPTTDSNKATHTTTVNDCCRCECLILVYFWDPRNFPHSFSSSSSWNKAE